MSLTSIVVIAIGLAMDAFAVSITCGIAIKKMHIDAHGQAHGT